MFGVFFCYKFVSMAAKPQTLRLYKDIKKEFDRMSAVREFGVQKHTTDWILNKLAIQFYKSPKTIENIVFNRTATTTTTNQTSLF